MTQGRQRDRGFFMRVVRGVSNAREGSKILTFLFRPEWCAELAPISPELVEGEFSEVCSPLSFVTNAWETVVL